MDSKQRKKRLEALTEALVLVGIARAEAESYTNDPRLQGIAEFQNQKLWDISRYNKTERALRKMCLELVDPEGEQCD
ncbi:hypothetical protein J7438_13475 [Thalassotalea sp. G20_0]|uniref:hypothetical protein n=1 Tax=Thalassotalea sp. G20_0 TaxID=2821093 RepID=UPI001ADB6CF7|nr:hypothetical protein [Thalassotalea sp. G20_0]MBO9495090.1 hypothetical protein [Thalassotalea sp. G20_0]